MVHDAYYSLYPWKKGVERVHARLLSREIATQMRGRALSWEVFPFSFREYLDFRGISAEFPMSTKRKMEVRNAFDGFWETGDFRRSLEWSRR